MTRRRIWLALAIALLADALQIGLGPLGWTLVDGVIDVVVMILCSLLLGFHPAFLPTFLVELIPIVDMLPTWTGCVVLVIALRRKHPKPAPPHQPPSDVIDI